ncbi:hypothetical protein GUJ93_ZPchr0015g6844 [Zizania palustris]|uniref:Uncharacterized protein n=1 Tax=Zizania palustris TaxID=103762 RepID=A0A8J5TGJ7_ZIZPA|nr:hypothetical protein GUJ93_ZPchr0015g6844 [Zizania palustris]
MAGAAAGPAVGGRWLRRRWARFRGGRWAGWVGGVGKEANGLGWSGNGAAVVLGDDAAKRRGRRRLPVEGAGWGRVVEMGYGDHLCRARKSPEPSGGDGDGVDLAVAGSGDR